MPLHLKLYKLSFFLAPLLLCGCNPKIYKPYPRIMPLFQDKGEGQADLQLSTTGIGVSAAYSPVEHLALLANASIWDGRDSGNNNGFHYNRPLKYNIFEVGGGYYEKVGNQGSFEILGGGGFGNRETSTHITNFFVGDPLTQYIIQTETANFFIQPGIGHVGKRFEYGFNIKFNCTSYFNFFYEKKENIVNGNPSDDSIESHWGPYTVIEPSIFIARGNGIVKEFIQVGLSIPVGGDPIIFSDEVSSAGYISLGIIIRLKDF